MRNLLLNTWLFTEAGYLWTIGIVTVVFPVIIFLLNRWFSSHKSEVMNEVTSRMQEYKSDYLQYQNSFEGKIHKDVSDMRVEVALIKKDLEASNKDLDKINNSLDSMSHDISEIKQDIAVLVSKQK